MLSSTMRTGMAYALREYMEDILSAREFHGGYAHMPMWSPNQWSGVISTRQVLALNPQDLHVYSLIVSPHCMVRNVSTQKLATAKCQSNLRVDFTRANLALFCCSLKTIFLIISAVVTFTGGPEGYSYFADVGLYLNSFHLLKNKQFQTPWQI